MGSVCVPCVTPVGLASSETDSDRVRPEWCAGSCVTDALVPPGVISESCRSLQIIHVSELPVCASCPAGVTIPDLPRSRMRCRSIWFSRVNI